MKRPSWVWFVCSISLFVGISDLFSGPVDISRAVNPSLLENTLQNSISTSRELISMFRELNDGSLGSSSSTVEELLQTTIADARKSLEKFHNPVFRVWLFVSGALTLILGAVFLMGTVSFFNLKIRGITLLKNAFFGSLLLEIIELAASVDVTSNILSSIPGIEDSVELTKIFFMLMNSVLPLVMLFVCDKASFIEEKKI